jgi:hypothetical protein
MVRFATDPDTAHTLDETRAFRGAHVAIFEDDDKGTALKALVPSLSWMVADGAPALPFGEVADFMLRVMTWQAADRATQRLVITSAPSIAPINRCWKLGRHRPLLGMHAADLPEGHAQGQDARRRQRLHLALHLGRCHRPLTGQHRLLPSPSDRATQAAARRARS